MISGLDKVQLSIASHHVFPTKSVFVWSSSLLNSSPVSLCPMWFTDRSLIRGFRWSYSSKALWLLIKCHLVWSMMGEGPHRSHGSQRRPWDSNKHGCTLLSLVLPLPKHVQPCPLGWVWTHPFLGSCWLHFQGSVCKLKGYLKSPSCIRTGEEYWPVFSFPTFITGQGPAVSERIAVPVARAEQW